MMERLLAKMDANQAGGMKAMHKHMEADREVLKEIMNANTKTMREDIKSDQAEMRSTIDAFKEKMDAWIANRKTDRKETTACHVEMEASIKKMESNSGEKEAVLERQKIPNEKVAVHSLRARRSEAAASQETMEADTEKIEPDRRLMQSVAEHQVAPKEDAIVKPVKGRKKRHKSRKLAAERRGVPKELNRRDCGSGKKSAAACRKVSSYAKVAWRKRHLFEKIGTQGNCGPRSKLTSAGIKTTRHAEVTWRERNSIRKDWTTDKGEREARRARMLRRRVQSRQENGKGIRELGGRRPLYRRKRRPTKNGIGGCKSGHRSLLGSRRTQKNALCEIVSMKIAQQRAEISEKTRRLEVAKRTARSTVEMHTMKDWTLWRGGPPPKRKKKLQIQEEPDNVEAPATP
jgi:hypothetical protein